MMRKRKLSRSSSSESIISDIKSEIDATSDIQKTKKHRKSYSFEEKNEILKALETHPYQHVSEEYGVHVRMLRKWQKKKAEIEAATENKNLCKKKKKRSFTEELDKRLYNWFIESRDTGILLTGPIIKKQALIFNEELGGKDKFMASDCWLDNWKKRMKLKNNEDISNQIESKVDGRGDNHERKRQRKKYSSEQKNEILKALETQSYHAVAQEYGVDEKLLYRWKKKKGKIGAANEDENIENDDLHTRLHEWFVQTQLTAEPTAEKKTDISNDEIIIPDIDPKIITKSDKQEMEKREIDVDSVDLHTRLHGWSTQISESKPLIVKNETVSDESDSECSATNNIQKMKNPHKNYSPDEKAEILEILKTKHYKYVAEEYDIDIEILRQWKNEEVKFKTAAEKLISLNKREKSAAGESDPRPCEWSIQAQLAELPLPECSNENKEDIPNDEIVCTQIESRIDTISDLKEGEERKNRNSLKQKNVILNALNTQSYQFVSQKYGVDEKQLHQWKAEKDGIESTTDNQSPPMDDLHTRLHEWFLQNQLAENSMAEPTSENKTDISNNETTSNEIDRNIHASSHIQKTKNCEDNCPIEKNQQPNEIPVVESISENKIPTFKITISKKLYANSDLTNDQEMKKHRRSYSFEQKNEILKVLNSQPYQYVCEEYGVNVRMLQKWKKQQARIEAATEHPILCKKKRKRCVTEELDTRLYEWSIQAKNSGIPVTAITLKKQALVLNAELGGRSSFKASEGWLDNWRKRTEELARPTDNEGARSGSKKKLNSKNVHESADVDSESDATSDVEETKKHRKSYTFEQKNEILKALESQSSQSVSEEYGVHERMLSKWKKKKAEILAAMENPALRKKKKRRIVTDELDARLYEWSIGARIAGIPLTGRMLKQQALIFNKLFGGKTDFRASDGWLDGWKKRTEARLAGIAEAHPPSDKKTIVSGDKNGSGAINSENDAINDESKRGEIETDNVDLHTRLHEWSIQAQFPGIPATKSVLQKNQRQLNDSESDAMSDIQEKKKHRKSYSFEEKAVILKLLETQPYQYVAEECGINIRVLRKWNKKRAEIEDAIQTQSLCRKRKKRASTEVLDALLYDWFTKAQRHGITVTGPTLKKQALILNKELGGRSKFRASDGWLDGWKKRKNVRFCNITEERKIS